MSHDPRVHPLPPRRRLLARRDCRRGGGDRVDEMSDTCNACGGDVWPGDRHACLPVFRVWCPECELPESDASEVRASCAQFAATRWAEEEDAKGGIYDIVRGTDATVHVRAPDGQTRVFVVSGKPRYMARLATVPK